MLNHLSPTASLYLWSAKNGVLHAFIAWNGENAALGIKLLVFLIIVIVIMSILFVIDDWISRGK